MSKDIQHFIFHLKPSASSAHPCIRLNAEVVHVIDDLNEFYAQIGFDKQSQTLPEAYIMEKFIQPSITKKCLSCLQLRIINYLVTHAESFEQKLGDQYKGLVTAHLADKFACGDTSCAEKPIQLSHLNLVLLDAQP
jgi:hypothetical protein